jgi:deoxyribose-phosphate aldolase
VDLNRMIDHTMLKPEAGPEAVARLCAEAIEYDFFSVCVNTHFVPLAAAEVAGTGVKVCSVAGFPLGAVDSKVKAFEAERAVGRGADEIDMVMNVGALKAGERKLVGEDIGLVKRACGEALLKVIIEAALLTDEEKREACRIVVDAGAQFVKSSTGFGPPGANPRDIKLMRETVGPGFGVKASAGIRTAASALELVRAGANRIGTSSGVQIISELKSGTAGEGEV